MYSEHRVGHVESDGTSSRHDGTTRDDRSRRDAGSGPRLATGSGGSRASGLLGLALCLAWVSEPHAADWISAQVPFDSAHVLAAATAPSAPGRVYVALDGLGIYRTEDRGESWLNASGRLPLDPRIRALAVADIDEDRAYAGLDGPSGGAARIFTTHNGGVSWAEVSQGIEGALISDILVRAGDPETALAVVRLGSSPGIYRTTDGGGSWSLSSVGLGGSAVWSLAQSPADPDDIIVGTDDGVARSTDGGLSWNPGGAAGNRIVDLAWSSADPTLVYAAASDALFRSADGGWGFAVSLPPEALGVHDVVADPTSPHVIYVSGQVSCGVVASGSAVWQSLDQGTSWSSIYLPGNLPDTGCGGAPTALLIDPTSPASLYLTQTHLADGFLRRRSGIWSVETNGLRNYEVERVLTDHQGAAYARGPWDLLRTAAPRDLWEKVEQGFWTTEPRLEASSSVPGLLHEAGNAGISDVIEQLARRSTDGGLTWSHEPGVLPSGLPYDDAPLTLVVSNHGDGETVYVWSGPRCYRSDDGHASYSEVSAVVSAVAAVLDPADPHRIVAAQDAFRS
ncbi:MAG: hypothetical protein R3E12_14250 [Candidatus Eisenbacteria bacterium]